RHAERETHGLQKGQQRLVVRFRQDSEKPVAPRTHRDRWSGFHRGMRCKAHAHMYESAQTLSLTTNTVTARSGTAYESACEHDAARAEPERPARVAAQGGL